MNTAQREAWVLAASPRLSVPETGGLTPAGEPHLPGSSVGLCLPEAAGCKDTPGLCPWPGHMTVGSTEASVAASSP